MPKKQDALPPIEAVTTDQKILALLLEEQREQTELLGRINTIVQLWGLLLILGIIFAVCSGLGILDALF